MRSTSSSSPGTELQLKADDPDAKADALVRLLDANHYDGEVALGETTVRFLPGGPRGRPELYGEVFDGSDT